MEKIIELGNISLTQKNFSEIKQNRPSLLSKFIKAHFEDFVSKWNELKLAITLNDVKLFLDSDELSNEQKALLLSCNFSVWQGINQKEILVWIGRKVIELNFSGHLTTPIAAVVRNLDDEEDLMKIIALQGKNLKEADVTNAINNKMSEPLKSCIIREGKQKTLPNNVDVRNLCAILQEKGIISSFKEDGDKIRVQQKRSSS